MKSVIVKLESYVGNDTYLECGEIISKLNDNPLFPKGKLWIIVDCETGEVYDYGYKSYKEAKQAYPEAVN